MEPYELSVVDDKVEYTKEEIRDLVTMIDVGNRTRSVQRSGGSGVARVVSAFGIVGEHFQLFVILCQITENKKITCIH
jgi:hypothetical protein